MLTWEGKGKGRGREGKGCQLMNYLYRIQKLYQLVNSQIHLNQGWCSMADQREKKKYEEHLLNSQIQRNQTTLSSVFFYKKNICMKTWLIINVTISSKVKESILEFAHFYYSDHTYTNIKCTCASMHASIMHSFNKLKEKKKLLS